MIKDFALHFGITIGLWIIILMIIKYFGGYVTTFYEGTIILFLINILYNQSQIHKPNGG